MQFSRHAVEVGGAGVVLALCAAVFAQPLMLFGAVGVGAWLLGRQRAFVDAADRMDQALTVRAVPSQTNTAVGREVPVTVSVELDEPSPLSLTIEPRGPLAATLTGASGTTLDAGETREDISYGVEFHVAGRHELAPLEVTVRDDRGLFEETIERGPRPAVTVGARGPSQLHVGRGASSVSEGFGETSRQSARRGLEPQEIREYVPGDVAKNIDWNTTARLGNLHVREYGTENHRHVVVVLDGRDSMSVGPPGETKFDYGREVTLGFLDSADSAFDSVALYSATADEVASIGRSDSATQAAGALRGPLLGLRPIGDGSVSATRAHVSPQSGTRVATSLRDDASTFDRTLRPYFGSRARTEAEQNDPIQTAIRRERMTADDELGVVVVTDDTEPRRIRETTRFARQNAEQVTLFLTPHVLFEPGGLGDLEAAYERYLEFEQLRRELDRLPNVTAFEVGPGDRLSAILDSRRQR